MYNINEIWMKLTTKEVGFYTKETAENIPHGPGVYAWFLPLELKFLSESLELFLQEIRRIQTYDSIKKGHSEDSILFNWEPLKISKDSDNVSFSKHDLNIWKKFSKVDKTIQDSTKLYALIGTLFTRPLYIGLSKKLKSRYLEHITNSAFNKRFTNYITYLLDQNKLVIEKKVEDLLFVCIPFANIEGNKKLNIIEEQKKLIETILKVVGQPIFGAK